MVITQGDVCWAELAEPVGSGPGLRRPVVVVQGNALNASRLGTVVVVPLTSNLRWADAPGNVMLERGLTGLPKDSVANASQIVSIDRTILTERAGHIPVATLQSVLHGIDVVLGTRSGSLGTILNEPPVQPASGASVVEALLEERSKGL